MSIYFSILTKYVKLYCYQYQITAKVVFLVIASAIKLNSDCKVSVSVRNTGGLNVKNLLKIRFKNREIEGP